MDKTIQAIIYILAAGCAAVLIARKLRAKPDARWQQLNEMYRDAKMKVPNLQFNMLDMLAASALYGVMLMVLQPSPPAAVYMLISGSLGFLAAADLTRCFRPNAHPSRIGA